MPSRFIAIIFQYFINPIESIIRLAFDRPGLQLTNEKGLRWSANVE